VKRKVEFKVQSPRDEPEIRKYVNTELRTPRTRRGPEGEVPVEKLDAWIDRALDERLRAYCARARRKKTAVVEEALAKLLQELGA
jgi:hypothetical protein